MNLRSGLTAAMAAAAVFLTSSSPTIAADPEIARGQYLVTIMGCGDCHTAGHFFGHPDTAHPLAGSDVAFGLPEGTFAGPNLTPDKETGLGNWTVPQIVTAITKGERPDGRALAPVMPWRGFSHLTAQDARAIAVYLKSLTPVSNRVPGPFGPREKAESFVMTIIPAEVYATLPKPPQ